MKTIKSASSQSAEHSALPEWVPLPSPKGQEKFTGLKRGKLWLMSRPCAENGFKPPVKSVSLRPSGCIKGKILVHLPSLLRHLENLADAQSAVESKIILTQPNAENHQ